MSMLGSLYAMPILVLNMGGEMIYILHQRLHAQSIAPEKARKVLADVVRTMYTPSFLEELFKPQDIYTVASTKQIFDKLAHSSIMRLNKTSMDKLFDLMSMGVKYQLLACRSPHQYLQLTMNHLESILEMVKSEGVSELIQAAIRASMELYSTIGKNINGISPIPLICKNRDKNTNPGCFFVVVEGPFSLFCLAKALNKKFPMFRKIGAL
jgi:hypothetical protein